MKSVIFVILVFLGVTAASGIDNTSALKGYLSRISTRDVDADLDIVFTFLLLCTDGFAYSETCFANSYKEPTNNLELCEMNRLSLNCVATAITMYTSTCPGAASASAAVKRLQAALEETVECSSATSVLAGLFTIILMASVHFLH
ncbi:hypothetical protein HA402_012970 [Bradysia odoriphaga]|nr:hypothetical protein HA402_012970 [Bradysia odoriphaga]